MMAIRENYVDQLVGYYRQEECGSTGCRKKNECGAIAGPKEPFIGSEFGKGRFPRLVVLSLDAGKIDSGTNCSVDRIEDGTWIPKVRGGKTRHWWRTLQLVYSILGDKPLSEASDREIAAAVNWMAHLNSARCTQNKARNAQADKLLFENCREFVKEELNILQPQILFTQGERAWDVIEDVARKVPKQPLGDSSGSYIRSFGFAGQPCRHVHFYNPSYWSGYVKQHNDLVRSGLLKKLLMKSQNSSLI